MAVTRAIACALVAARWQPAHAKVEQFIGESGKPVSGCQCAGPSTTHGECGYHFHMGSSEEWPWCRTLHKCGESSIRGSWMYCDVRGVQRRRADDGVLYTSLEFKKHYGNDGKEKWLAAKEGVERRVASNYAAYTISEFKAFSIDSLGEKGWFDTWASAAEEKKKAEDGKWYAFHEFQSYYGKSAMEKWRASEVARARSDSKPALGCRCKGARDTHGYCGFHLHWGSNEKIPWCRTQSACGTSSIKGSWKYCDDSPTERRRAADGKLYTVREFADHFKGEGAQKWKTAAAYVERRQAGGSSYTVHEFRDFYVDEWGENGWGLKWMNALPEQRKAQDGKWYTWEEFAHWLGTQPWEEWTAAAPSGGMATWKKEL